jgi:hypothetical protein
LKVGKFLGMVRRVRRTLVEFDDPQRPVIRLSRLSATDFAAHILEQSDEPLTAEEIHSGQRSSVAKREPLATR